MIVNHAPRQQQIADLVLAQGGSSVEELAQRFAVSGMTIRRDLQLLQSQGQIMRTHGGAAPAQRVSFEFRFLQHAQENRWAKNAIGDCASALVGDGQSLMLDSGTTTLALAKHLRDRRNLTIITTSLPIASELQFCDGIEVILLGGLLRRGAPDLTGPLTEANLQTFCADIAFIGADGIDLKGNIYNNSPTVAQMLAKMARSAKRIYVLADHSKIGRTALMRFGNIANWDGLITDKGLDRAMLNKLRRAGVNIKQARTDRSAKEPQS